MRTLWDHWKRETQEQHSFFHELIEDMVEGIVRGVVDELPREDLAVLTLATDAMDDPDHEPGRSIVVPDAVARELMQRINELAGNEPHRREVQRLLDDQSRDRFERDIEPYR